MTAQLWFTLLLQIICKKHKIKITNKSFEVGSTVSLSYKRDKYYL